jgi:hypothetical protein
MRTGKITGIIGVLLLLSAGLQIWSTYMSKQQVNWSGPTLAKSFEDEFGGSRFVDLPLAGSPEEWNAIKEGLNFSDYVFKQIHTPAGEVSIYMASWAANTMAPRLVQTHTPDVCWVRVGWTMKSANTSEVDFKGHKWVVAQRVFTSNIGEQNVKFWHVLGGDSFTYGRVGNIPWWAAFVDILKYGSKLRSPHVFVRISSPAQLEEIFDSPQGERLLDWALRNSYDRSSLDESG